MTAEEKAVVIDVSDILYVQTVNCFLFVVLDVAVRCLGHITKLDGLIVILTGHAPVQRHLS